MKNLLQRLKDNLTEIYLGSLLFIGLPIIISVFFDWRFGVLSSILIQSAVIILYIARGR